MAPNIIRDNTVGPDIRDHNVVILVSTTDTSTQLEQQ